MAMRAEDISVGTSGWKFDDWAGSFYPFRVPQSKWLEYYAARFPIGEINSTYYRIARSSSYASIARNTPPDFKLFAKVHADVTHKRNNPEESLRVLIAALDPLRTEGKLLGLLAQFPASFRCSAESVDYLRRLRDGCADIRLCVEFRHRSWSNDAALERVREIGLVWVSPDEPALPDLMPFRFVVSSDILYVRLHGHNAAAWYNREAGDRYDYDYSTEELAAIGKQLLAAEVSARHGYILFNNCHLGKAPRNALWLRNWLAASTSSRGDNTPSNDLSFSAH
jgi:uncharacterized protein YecE (DUF72 family)